MEQYSSTLTWFWNYVYGLG